MRRRRVTVLAVLVAAATAGVATAATGPAPVAATDAQGDVTSPLEHIARKFEEAKPPA